MTKLAKHPKNNKSNKIAKLTAGWQRQRTTKQLLSFIDSKWDDLEDLL